MVATETARTVILILLGLSVLWVIVCVVRNDTATLVRALIVTVLFGVAFYYLNQTKLPTLTVRGIKEDLFPPKPIHASFEKRTAYINGVERTIYSFAEPGPELTLSMEGGGSNLSITDIEPLNRLLRYVGLPPVKRGARELSAITGVSLDTDKYRWEDYALGILIIERGICRNVATTNTYPCVETITIIAR
ncbi:MAG: hypothetical protein ABSG19_09895 [Candidatus Aminicenantales bacterium]